VRSGWRVTGSLTLVLIVAVLAGCSSSSVAPVESASKTPTRKASAPNGAHIVKRGDTLYSIAWRYRLDYRQVAVWNAIHEPFTIYPGQRLRLTQPPVMSSTTASQPRAAASGGIKKTPLPAPSASSEKSARAPDAAVKATSGKSESKKTASAPSLQKSGKGAVKDGNVPVKRWYWPAKGKVITSFSQSGSKGINIAGKLGQPILAAYNGRVVYSGSGLIGYGQLIIVKHNKRYLSAYAHNNKIIVKEGDTVTGGQRIAEMGRSGSNRTMLHFEIRRDGKPIDPVRYLPK